MNAAQQESSSPNLLRTETEPIRSGREILFGKEELNTLFCFQFVTLKTFCSNADMKDSNKHTCWVCVCRPCGRKSNMFKVQSQSDWFV